MKNVIVLSTASDAKLAKWFRHGVNGAFDVLWLRHRQSVKVHLHNLGIRAALIEDASQMVWLRVAYCLRRRKEYCERGHFIQWLKRLVRNIAKNIKKKEHFLAHEEYVEDEPGGNESFTLIATEEDEEVRRERLREIDRMADDMREPMRSVVRMKIIDGLGYRQIAEKLHLKENIVRAIFSRAVERMKREVGRKR